MKFSILIPTYNGSLFLEEAINSALNQTRTADEIIVSDDNSKDNTLEICHKFKDKIKIFCNENGPSGFVQGWNNAIKYATSDYICILHQDDRLKPTFLEEIEKMALKNPDVKHFFTPCDYIDGNGDIIRTTLLEYGGTIRYKGIDYVHAYMQQGCPHIHRCPGVVTHKDIFKLCQYRKEAGHIADDDFFYRVGQYTDIIGVLQPLAQYREHQESETGHLKEKERINRITNDYIFQLTEFDNNKLFDDICKKYLKQQLKIISEREIDYAVKKSDCDVFESSMGHHNILLHYGIRMGLYYRFLYTLLSSIGLSATHWLLLPIYTMCRAFIILKMKISKLIRRLKHLTNPMLCYQIALSYTKRYIARFTGFQWQHFVLFSIEEADIQSIIKGFSPIDNILIANTHDLEDEEFIQEIGYEHYELLKERCESNLYDCIILTEHSIGESQIRRDVKCYGCISYKNLEITSAQRYLLNDKEAFLFDAYCLQGARRKGYYKQVLISRLQILADKGLKKVLTIVDTLNTPSIQAHKGWKKEQTFYWFKFRGKEYSTLKHYSKL